MASLPKTLIFLLVALIIGSSLFYSIYLANQLEANERQSIELKSKAIHIQGNYFPSNNITAFEQASQDYISSIIISEDNRVPWMLTDKDFNFVDGRNLPYPDSQLRADPELANRLIESFKESKTPIRVELGSPSFWRNVVYGESRLLKQLRWFPWVQSAVALLFIILVFAGFASAKRSEQNKVWVGLAKETAHQLGTPVSSLMAWIELLRMELEGNADGTEYVEAMEEDVKRLDNIADRFSKIGSEPELLSIFVKDILDESSEYLKARMTRSGRVSLEVNNELPPDRKLNINPQLFSWVIENLLKNALDAIQAERGKISIDARETASFYQIDIIDTGKGISKGNVKKVFEPGFTTKKRGWGLGLSLSKRIIESYHKGKIFVHQSEQGVGTTFRILLPK